MEIERQLISLGIKQYWNREKLEKEITRINKPRKNKIVISIEKTWQKIELGQSLRMVRS